MECLRWEIKCFSSVQASEPQHCDARGETQRWSQTSRKEKCQVWAKDEKTGYTLNYTAILNRPHRAKIMLKYANVK